MTYYPVFVKKECWNDTQSTVYTSNLVHMSMNEDDAIEWIRKTDAKEIFERATGLVKGTGDLLIKNIENDTWIERAKCREFFTEENFGYGIDTYLYTVFFKQFDNEFGCF